MATLLQEKQKKGISRIDQKIWDDRKKLADQLKKAAELHLNASKKLTQAAQRIENYKEDSIIHIAAEAYKVVNEVRKAQRLLSLQT
jgi:hypothetical protein